MNKLLIMNNYYVTAVKNAVSQIIQKCNYTPIEDFLIVSIKRNFTSTECAKILQQLNTKNAQRQYISSTIYDKGEPQVCQLKSKNYVFLQLSQK